MKKETFKWRSRDSEGWEVFHKKRPRWDHTEWRGRKDEIGMMPDRFWKQGIFAIIRAFFSLRRIK
jgi:hypothetical protein